MKNFSELLEELREERQISKKDLALRAGLTPGYVSLLTRGERTAPSEETVEALVDALDLGEEAKIAFYKAAGYSAPPAFSSSSIVPQRASVSVRKNARVDWGEAPDVEYFYGRQEECARLEHWAADERCRVIAIQGIGGIGKTCLVTTLAMQIKDKFDYVFWRSLQDIPPAESMLRECIQFLSDQKPIPLTEKEENQLPLLLEILLESLRDRRCLIVLDNFESVLQSGERVGEYREKYEGYGRLIQRLGESAHQSCLLLTSREKPREIVLLEGDMMPVRSLILSGMGELESKKLLKSKGIFGSDETWARLIELYSGNPLALKLVSEPIRELFGGNIAEFLSEGAIVVGDMNYLLDQQFARLSALEEEIMYWLAIERESVSLKDLQGNIVHPVSRKALLVAADSLRRRSLIETSGVGYFTLQPVIMEFVTDRFVEKVNKEILSNGSGFLESYALIKAQAKDYIRKRQIRLILTPVAEHLLTRLGKVGAEQKLLSFFPKLRQVYSQMTGYTAGNILNILIHLRVDLRDTDLSELTVQQAYLQGVALPDTNFARANLAKSVFTGTFGSVFTIALNPTGEQLAAGTDNGDIRLWQVADGRPLLTCEGHTNWVRSVAFSPDGRTLASGSDDQSIRLWDVSAGECLKILQGHTNWVRSVAFSLDSRTLASGSDDRSVRLWDVSSGECLKILQGHSHRVRSVAFSPDGRTLASGSADQSIRLWDASSGECLKILQGHSHRVRSVAFSPDGRTLASGSDDQSIRLWDVSSGECLKILQEHTHWVRSVAFSPDGRTLASGSQEGSIKLYDVEKSEYVQTLRNERPYERMNITHATGLTIAQKAMLRTLGAFEE